MFEAVNDSVVDGLGWKTVSVSFVGQKAIRFAPSIGAERLPR